MKKVIIIITAVIAVLAITITLLVNKLDKDVEDILSTTIQEIDLTNIEDGTYEGEYNVAVAVNATVRVIVEDNLISDIEITSHQNGQGEPAEVIIYDVIAEQSILVDDISGATYSSRVLKLAIYDALKED